MIIQFCGLSGSGKTTLAFNSKKLLSEKGLDVEVIDGDEYRKRLFPELGYTREHRHCNIRRLAYIAARFAEHGVIPIVAAINPYKEIRDEVCETYLGVKTIFIKCSLEVLIQRDTKGLYTQALSPRENQKGITNLSGVNDPFDVPEHADLIIETDKETIEESTYKLVNFIIQNNMALQK